MATHPIADRIMKLKELLSQLNSIAQEHGDDIEVVFDDLSDVYAIEDASTANACRIGDVLFLELSTAKESFTVCRLQ